MKHQLDHRLRLLATALLLSGTLLTCLFSCKKEEIPEDPVKGVVLTVSVSVPQAVLDVADIAVSMRTPYALETKSVDETKWVYHFEVAEPSGAHLRKTFPAASSGSLPSGATAPSSRLTTHGGER